MRSFHTPNHAPGNQARRILTFKAFSKMGGTVGMIRRIIFGWQRPFTVNQLKVAFHRQNPGMVLGDFQIEDILNYMVERKQLVRLGDASYQRPQFLKQAA